MKVSYEEEWGFWAFAGDGDRIAMMYSFPTFAILWGFSNFWMKWIDGPFHQRLKKIPKPSEEAPNASSQGL